VVIEAHALPSLLGQTSITEWVYFKRDRRVGKIEALEGNSLTCNGKLLGEFAELVNKSRKFGFC